MNSGRKDPEFNAAFERKQILLQARDMMVFILDMASKCGPCKEGAECNCSGLLRLTSVYKLTEMAETRP